MHRFIKALLLLFVICMVNSNNTLAFDQETVSQAKKVMNKFEHKIVKICFDAGHDHTYTKDEVTYAVVQASIKLAGGPEKMLDHPEVRKWVFLNKDICEQSYTYGHEKDYVGFAALSALIDAETR